MASDKAQALPDIGFQEGVVTIQNHLEVELRRMDPSGLIGKSLHPDFLSAVSRESAWLEADRRQARNAVISAGNPSPQQVVNATEGVTYHIPANYWVWKRVKAYMDNSARLGRGETLDKRNNIDPDSRKAFSCFSELGCPFYLVGSPFLNELEDTDMFIDDLRILEEAPLPAESFLLLLPSGSFTLTHKAEEFPVKALHVAHVDDGLWFGAIREVEGEPAMITGVLGFREDGTLPNNVEQMVETTDAAIISEEELHRTLKMGAFVTKILAAMAAEPKIVEVAVTESVRKAKRDRPELCFMTPNVIGWRVKYVRSAPRTQVHDGPKGKKASHWRRRHIKRVPYGPQSVPLELRPRRIVVIERTRVNSEYEEQKVS
jgi:hypothetical protein